MRACELISKKYRSEMVAATMLGQGKNIFQSEIDAAAETVDFFRYYIQEAGTLSSQQPQIQPHGVWNKVEYRPLEGFVYAIAPFNFTALGATLVGPSALMGNVVVWKPSPSGVHSAWLLYQALLEAGLPEGVVQFLPGDAEQITNTVLKRKEFAALSYIGSTAVFKGLQQKIGEAVGRGTFASYPRVVGETSGKNWTVVHKSADVRNAVMNVIRSTFEYQGQKCSALSRLYVAESVWPEFGNILKEEVSKIKVGDPENYENFVNAVIHERAFDKLSTAIEEAKNDSELELVTGGRCSKEVGYYVPPTIYRTTNPKHKLMSTEYFGPLLCTYVYKDNEWDEVLKLIDGTSTYALTGAIFARDQIAIIQAQNVLKHAAGMFYINTKCTGSVVAQQPFGGSRDSGTNDKTGTAAHLQRFVSARTIKEDFGTLDSFEYPSNEV